MMGPLTIAFEICSLILLVDLWFNYSTYKSVFGRFNRLGLIYKDKCLVNCAFLYVAATLILLDYFSGGTWT